MVWLYSDQERAASDYSNKAFGPQLRSYHLHSGLVFWVWELKGASGVGRGISVRVYAVEVVVLFSSLFINSSLII